MLVEVLKFVNLLCAGVLAGEEFVIRFGVRGPVANLDPQPGIQLRQALIRRLRVLVPAIFGLAFFSGIAVTLLEGFGPGLGFHCAGLLSLVAFISITLAGTVPINQAVLTWEAAAPPEGWRAMIDRWERLDTARTWAAIAAFSLFLADVALR
jgi:uncharacterized membrane protein